MSFRKVRQINKTIKQLQEPDLKLEIHVFVDIDETTVTYTANGEEISESEYLRLKAIQKYGIGEIEVEIVD